MEAQERGLGEHDIEHYRPKGRVTDWRPATAGIDNPTPTAGLSGGYYLLAYHPYNYATACGPCNSVLKGDRFPIWGAYRLTGENPADLTGERPLLIFPPGRPAHPLETAAMSYCDFHRLGRDIIILEGQELLLGKQGDVAQVVLHRRGGVLTILDSGVFDQDRQAIVRAAQELGDFSKVVLINSHGHIDHVGNNDVIYELGALEVEHYVPRKDYPNLCDQAGFFLKLMDEASGYLDMGSPAETVAKLMALFRSPRHNAERVVMLEDRFDLEACTVAGVSFQAYRVGNVLVIPTEGHTVGHVCFFFEDEGFFYGADEFIGAVAPWGDSSPDRQLSACRLVIDLVNAGAIKHAARGHHWGYLSGRDFAAEMEKIINETEQWHRHMGKLLQSGSRTVFEMVEAMRDRMPESFGPNANPLFDTMKVLNTCHRLEAAQQGDPPTAVFSRVVPAHG